MTDVRIRLFPDCWKFYRVSDLKLVKFSLKIKEDFKDTYQNFQEKSLLIVEWQLRRKFRNGLESRISNDYDIKAVVLSFQNIL